MANHSAGAVIIFLEVRSPTEQQKQLVHNYASFMHSFLGRGVCKFPQPVITKVEGITLLSCASPPCLPLMPVYVLLGVLLLNYYTILYICGSLIALIGAIYIALNWVPIDTPSTMQAPSDDPEAQPVWQAPTE